MIVAAIQARSTSTRLPNKVHQLIDGVSMIGHVVATARRISGVDSVVIAAPESDSAVLEAAKNLDVATIPGPEHDVLERYRQVVAETGADVVIRITADCPLLDADLGSEALADALIRESDYFFRRGYPRGTGDFEILSAIAIELAAREARGLSDREHVVPWIERATDSLRVDVVDAEGWRWRPELRVCVDEEADLRAVRAVFVATSIRPIGVDTVIRVLDTFPEIRRINADVHQEIPSDPRK